jgi:hypothetical protein
MIKIIKSSLYNIRKKVTKVVKIYMNNFLKKIRIQIYELTALFLMDD